MASIFSESNDDHKFIIMLEITTKPRLKRLSAKANLHKQRVSLREFFRVLFGLRATPFFSP